MLSSWRRLKQTSFMTQYSLSGAAGVSELGSDPFCSPIAQVANFLAYLYKDGYQYSSVNTYRLAISLVHEMIDGYTVGQCPLVCRLVKGVFYGRPPLTHYSQTWDIQKVLNIDTPVLSLKHLSWKVTMLLALSYPSRSPDLSKLEIYKQVYWSLFLSKHFDQAVKVKVHITDYQFHFPYPFRR